jgi:large subunit ribosomal protein L10
MAEGPFPIEEEQMPRPEKVRAVEEIRERIEGARATFLTEYRGLSVSEQQALRRSLRAAGAEYKVVKMSLARRAAAELGFEELSEAMAGPTAIAFADDDPVPVAKALGDFAKDHEHLVVKVGLMSGELLLPEQVSRLAEIEPRDVLLGRIAGAAKAPLTKMAGFLGSFLRDSASMFSQLLDKKESGEFLPAGSEAVESAEVPSSSDEAAEAEQAPVERPVAEEGAAEESAEATQEAAAEKAEADERDADEPSEAAPETPEAADEPAGEDEPTEDEQPADEAEEE